MRLLLMRLRMCGQKVHLANGHTVLCALSAVLGEQYGQHEVKAIEARKERQCNFRSGELPPLALTN